MSGEVEWEADGTPRSPRFDDVYRSRAGGLAQARHVFLGGCGLPAAWAGRPQWRILETGFGLGLNFLAAWQAWRDDPSRPGLLHVVSVEGFPVAADDLRRSAAAHPALAPLAEQLAAQWWDLRPGVHRLAFEGGRVLLTLCIGQVHDMLRELAFTADAVFLDGFDPRRNQQMWDTAALRGVARCCRRGTRLATWTAAGEVRRTLTECGFAVEKMDGLPPKRDAVRARFDPAWEPRARQQPAPVQPGRCIVVGAGLAGAAVAASLARRGWTVEVRDGATAPATGASGLPAGLMAPHVSGDDNLLSRLSRAGVRTTLQQAQALLGPDDWAPSGAEERRSGRALHHPHAAWIKPAALVRAWLAQPGVRFRGGLPAGPGDIEVLRSQADLVVVAAALGSARLLAGLPLNAVRGQVSWAVHRPGVAAALPALPLNGNGHFLPRVPLAGGLAWLCGSTYGRGDAGTDLRAADQEANQERLRALAPEVAPLLAPQFLAGEVQAWAGVRCTSLDRRPLVGEWLPGVWVSTAMGSRGLTFAALCAELLAARLHGEPLPIAPRLAAALDVQRLRAA